jgi:hypothetical protein
VPTALGITESNALSNCFSSESKASKLVIISTINLMLINFYLVKLKPLEIWRGKYALNILPPAGNNPSGNS